MNIGTFLLLTIAFDLIEWNLPKLPSKLNMMLFIVGLIGLNAFWLMRKNQLVMYREKLLSLSLYDIKRTSRNAAIYVVGTVIIFFLTAFTTVNFFLEK